MITPYVRPQDTITQILRQTAQRTTSRRNPIVIGPQFSLYLNDGRDLSGAYLGFDSAGATDNLYADTKGVALNLTKLKPHTATAALYGSGLQALVATFTGAPNGWTLDENDTTFRTLRSPADNLAGAGTLNTDLDGRPIRIGDIISSDYDAGTPTGTTRRTVVGLLGTVTASSYDDTAIGVLNPVTLAAAAAVKVSANTTSGLDVDSPPTIHATDVAMLKGAGKVQLVGSDYRLCDVLDFTCVLGGINTVATFNVTSLATGITTPSPVTSAAGGPGTEFTIDLTTAGYVGATDVILTKASAMVAGDKIRVILQPVFTPNTETQLVVSGTYTGAVDRRYAIEVTERDATDIDVEVYDVTGEDPTVAYTDAIAGSALDIGTSGLIFNPTTIGGFAKGQIFYVDCVAAAASTTEFDGLLLDGPVVPSAEVTAAGGAGSITFTSTTVFQSYSGLLDDTNTAGVDAALVANAADWDYAAGLGLPSTATGRNGSDFSLFAGGYGSVYLSFKALVIPLVGETVIEINRDVDIVPKVGETGIENWLGRGTLEAFTGNQNRVVYALRTGGDTVADFKTALRKIQTTDRVYALAGMTDDEAVMELLRDHCTTMSNKFNKNFRRAYIGTDSPGAYVHWGALTGGGYRTGDLASSVLTLDAAFRSAWKFVATDVGSTITLQSVGQTYTILEVLSDFEVLTDAADVLTVSNSNLILTRVDTPANTALYVQARSVKLGSRRISNVWCDNPTVTENSVTVVLPAKFLAAEIAGLRCALLPQQGLTMTEVTSVEAAPSMFTSFDPADLDGVAAAGTFIVTQESEGGDVFVRHQLTTGTDEGALAYEDNVGVIVDEFGYAVKDAFRGYVGRRNATSDTIAEMDDKLKALATDFTQVELANINIGPPVTTFFDEKGIEGEVTVRQDGDLADTLMTYVKLRVPLPLNGINHFIDVDVAEVLASADNV